MEVNTLVQEILDKKSFLCVGLDTDIQRIPDFLLDYDDPVYEFNKRIIDATKDLCVAYKPNIAFYEAQGVKGWISLEKTLSYIPENIFTIADAKRGDIGNTSSQYARTFFETYSFDSLTIAPYMGKDSVSPFLKFEDKIVILLALTSNVGSLDFQFIRDEEGKQLFEHVIIQSQEWGTPDNMMYVVGATRTEHFKYIRKLAPDHFLLVPGVGAQGGSLEEVCKYGINDRVGLLVNSSRGIIYAGNDPDFDQKARQAALNIQNRMSSILKEHKLV